MTSLDTITQAPSGPPAASPLGPQSPLAQAAGEYKSRIEGLAADEQKTFAAQEQAESPYRDKLLNVLNSPNAAQAHLEKVKDAPKPEDYQKGALEFASAMAVMGALAGRFTRKGGTAALSAFTGAINGWKQGNLEAYENASKEWEANTKKTIENNNIEIEKYREIMADKKANIDQMMAAMNLVSTQFQNKLMFDATMEKNYTMAFGAVDKMVTAQQRLEDSFAKLTGIRGDQKQALQSQIDSLNANPALAQRIMQEKPADWLKLKGAAETMGLKLNDPAAGTQAIPKVAGAQPRSAPAMALRKFMDEHPDATSDQISEFAANYAGGVAAERTVGNRAGNIAVSVEEADRTFALAQQASDAVPRGKYTPLNRLRQQTQLLSSDPAYRQFLDANEAAVTAYGATMSRSGANPVAAQTRAHSVLDTADSPEAYRAGLDQLRKEAAEVEKAPAAVKQKLMQQYFGSSGSNAEGSSLRTQGNIPQRPGNVPSGSAYSPSRNMWKDPSGNLYGPDGTPARD